MFLVLFGGKPRFEDTLKDALKSARSDERAAAAERQKAIAAIQAPEKTCFLCVGRLWNCHIQID